MSKFFNPDYNAIFIGKHNKLTEWLDNEIANEQKVIEKVKLLLKNYLELDNVSFLFGSGSSVHLGSVSIRNFPKEIEQHIVQKQSIIENQKKPFSGIHDKLLEITGLLQQSWRNPIKELIDRELDMEELTEDEVTQLTNFNEWYVLEDHIIRTKNEGDIALELEKILNYLSAEIYMAVLAGREEEVKVSEQLLAACKEGLFAAVDIDSRIVPFHVLDKKKKSDFEHDQHHAHLLENENKYIFHKKFLKALLQRPLSLRRASLFTLNYDLAFEYSFDQLGIKYIDGFTGFHKRTFQPETFDYDIFYPGSTTAGKVQRIEKVLRFFKLHGSISWVSSVQRDSSNLYGLEEMPLQLINKLNRKGEIVIYPTALKKSYTLDLPYSEMFRQFSTTVAQPQSVLVTIGYAFSDEHLNDIIFQALANPSFTLIIVDLYGTKNNPALERIKELDDKRVILFQGDFFGDFLTFSTLLIPDFYDVGSQIKVAKTLNEYFQAADQKNPTL